MSLRVQHNSKFCYGFFTTFSICPLIIGICCNRNTGYRIQDTWYRIQEYRNAEIGLHCIPVIWITQMEYGMFLESPFLSIFSPFSINIYWCNLELTLMKGALMFYPCLFYPSDNVWCSWHADTLTRLGARIFLLISHLLGSHSKYQ